MSNAEWESLCDGCARCCLEKLEDEDTGKIYSPTCLQAVGCSCCACKDYADPLRPGSGLVPLTPGDVRTLNWLPPSCGCSCVAEGRVSIGRIR